MEEHTCNEEEPSLSLDGGEDDQHASASEEQKTEHEIDEALIVEDECNSSLTRKGAVPRQKQQQQQQQPPAAARFLERFSSVTKMRGFLPNKHSDSNNNNSDLDEQGQQQKVKKMRQQGDNDNDTDNTILITKHKEKEKADGDDVAEGAPDNDSECATKTNYNFDSLGELYAPGTKVLAKSIFPSRNNDNDVDMLCKVVWNRYVKVQDSGTESSESAAGKGKGNSRDKQTITTSLFKVCFQFLVALPGGEHFTTVDFVETLYQTFDGSRALTSLMKHQRFIPLGVFGNISNNTISCNNNENQDDEAMSRMMQRFQKRGYMYSKYAGINRDLLFTSISEDSNLTERRQNVDEHQSNISAPVGVIAGDNNNNGSKGHYLAYSKNSFYPKASSSSYQFQSGSLSVTSLFASYYCGPKNDDNSNYVDFSSSYGRSHKANNYSYLTERKHQTGMIYYDITSKRRTYDSNDINFYASSSIDTAQPSSLGGRIVVDAMGAFEAREDNLSLGYEPMLLAITWKYEEYMQYRKRQKSREREEQKHPTYSYYDKQQNYSRGRGAVGSSSSSSSNYRDIETNNYDYKDMIFEKNLFDDVPEEYIEMTWPAMVGFAFDLNVWGDVLIDGLSIIENFQDSIFDELSLPSLNNECLSKRMVKALALQHYQQRRQMVISDNSSTTTQYDDKRATTYSHTFLGRCLTRRRGKDDRDGTGITILLHGPSGVGKTLTVQALTEMLHRPLCIVTSMGQLAVMTDVGQRKWVAYLGDMLQSCSRWGATVLLEEANMMLEKKTYDNAKLKAIMQIIICMIESFRGILFLKVTTSSDNVSDKTAASSSFNQAFQKHGVDISFVLKFDMLQRKERYHVWTYLLTTFGYKNFLVPTQNSNTENDTLPTDSRDSTMINTWSLSKHSLNGHDIKNAIHFAMSLAQEEENGNITGNNSIEGDCPMHLLGVKEKKNL